MRDERAVGQSRALVGRCCAMAVALALPAAAQPSRDPLRILGFQRQLAPDAIELIVACSGPVSFRYSSPTLETIRLVLPGVDPAGVTPPRDAWGEDLAGVELAPAEGDEAPGAVLVLELREFRPYSIRTENTELRVELDAPGIGARPPPPRGTEVAGDDLPEVPFPPGAEPLEPSPGAVSPDADALPPTLEPDFFEGAAPEPPAAGAPDPEPAPAAATDPPVPAPPETGSLDEEAPAATRIFEVARHDRDGVLAIRIPADGRPSYQAFFTRDGPERLVLDFEGTESRPLFQTLDVGVGPVRRVRVGQHEAEPVPIVRVVVDLDERVSHRIETDATGLTLRFDGVPVEP